MVFDFFASVLDHGSDLTGDVALLVLNPGLCILLRLNQKEHGLLSIYATTFLVLIPPKDSPQLLITDDVGRCFNEVVNQRKDIPASRL